MISNPKEMSSHDFQSVRSLGGSNCGGKIASLAANHARGTIRNGIVHVYVCVCMCTYSMYVDGVSEIWARDAQVPIHYALAWFLQKYPNTQSSDVVGL